MKANEAPEKLYFGEYDKGILNIYSNKEPNDEIEYTRNDTLEVKEVDLDKEIEQSFIDLDYHLDAYNRVEDYVGENIDMVEYKRIAKHFYELGLKVAQKGEKV